jgi:hypothetical protein
VDLSPGVPIGCRLPRKRGPYSTPKHSLYRNDDRILAFIWHLSPPVAKSEKTKANQYHAKNKIAT